MFHVEGEAARKITLVFDNSAGVRENVVIDQRLTVELPQSGSLVDAVVELDGLGGGSIREIKPLNEPLDTTVQARGVTSTVSHRVGLFFVSFSGSKACGSASNPEDCAGFMQSEADTSSALYGSTKSVVEFYKVVSRGKRVIFANAQQTHRLELKSASSEDDVVFQANAARINPKPSSYDFSIFILPKNFYRGSFEGGGAAGFGEMDGRNSW
jgi:hypothetical protein